MREAERRKTEVLTGRHCQIDRELQTTNIHILKERDVDQVSLWDKKAIEGTKDETEIYIHKDR